MTDARLSDYITLVRAANRKVWDGINELAAMQREWAALEYSKNLKDGTGSNLGLVKENIEAVVFDTTNALVATLNEGHATNMAKLL